MLSVAESLAPASPLSSALSSAALPLPSPLPPLRLAALAPLHLASSYGLFRRMTGAGPLDARGAGPVARPEVLVEGSADGAAWLPLHFRYKPGAPAGPLRVAAPLQPRLDWQMWFAALGTYRHSPFLVHLAYKLLAGVPEAYALLPPQRFSPASPPRLLRMALYHYDFAPLLPGGPVWNRTLAHQAYLPVVDLAALAPVVRQFPDWCQPETPQTAPKAYLLDPLRWVPFEYYVFVLWMLLFWIIIQSIVSFLKSR